ncbi:MAG: hypothetical protein ABIW76_18105 [Fibrobacteria bacterium]
MPFAITLAAATSAYAAEVGKDSVISEPLAISAAIDVGQIVSGWSQNPQASLDGQFLQRTGVWLTQRASIGGRFDLTMGVGGMFWHALPEQRNSPLSVSTRFGPGISRAFGVYKFGDLEAPAATLQMGYFPFKYNPEATNLGEYLLRSGTYPGTLVTGGWNIITSAAYMMQGLRLTVPLWDGRFVSDFVLPMERDLPPMYSLSPTYVATLKLFPGLELGAGVVWNHGIPIKPSKESPHTESNRVILSRTLNPDTMAVGDGSGGEYYLYTYDTSSYYTFQGLKIGGRISLDPKAFLRETSMGPQDLKIYAEVAVLGWKNYPFLYEKRSERMPMMAGFNFPTFRLLDLLSIEVQYYKSGFENNIYQVFMSQVPTWTLVDPSGLALGKGYAAVAAKAAEQNERIAGDNLKWSVYAKKEVYKGLRLYAQVASDHMRPTDVNQNPFSVPVTNGNGKEWYYLLRLEFGI